MASQTPDLAAVVEHLEELERELSVEKEGTGHLLARKCRILREADFTSGP